MEEKRNKKLEEMNEMDKLLFEEGKTYFAPHTQTRKNKDETHFNSRLENEKKYDPSKLSKNDLPAKQEIAQGQADDPLITKGKLQAEILGEELLKNGAIIDRIYCGDQERCYQTAQIVAKIIGLPESAIIRDDRINARKYGIISNLQIEVDRLKHFWKYPISLKMLKLIAFYIVAPEKIGVEKKSDYEERVMSFINDENVKMKNTFIVGGSDFLKLIYNKNYYYENSDKTEHELRRGEYLVADFTEYKVAEKSALRPKFYKRKTKTIEEEIALNQ